MLILLLFFVIPLLVSLLVWWMVWRAIRHATPYPDDFADSLEERILYRDFIGRHEQEILRNGRKLTLYVNGEPVKEARLYDIDND